LAVISEAVRRLQTLAKRLHDVGGLLLSMDAADRWGPKAGPDRERLDRDIAEAQREHHAVKAQLIAEVAAVRSEDPASLRVWIDAHVRLLDEFSTRQEEGSTERSVAQRERAQWLALEESGDFVHQNTFYVRYDDALYAELFG
jgi:hypothetical protein